MKTYRPSSRTEKLWRVRSLLFMAIVAAVGLWFLFLTPYILAGLAGILVLLIIFNFLYLPRYIRSYCVTVGSNSLIIKSGIFIKKERIMPQHRLIYTERRTTPLARRFNLSSLSLRAARAVTFTIELDKNDIDEITEVLSR